MLVLLSALFATISDTIRENAENRRKLEERRRYEDIDWGNIERVDFYGTQNAFRIEEEEEYDPTYTIALSEMNGAPCYGTKTVQHLVENGENYCFNIRYKNGTEIYREFHETSPLAERLLEYCNKNNVSSKISSVCKAVNNVVSEIGNMFGSGYGYSDYETAFLNFKQMQSLLELNENSTQEEFEKAAEIKMSSVIMSNTDDFNQSIYELMLYLLSSEEDGDILEKTDKDELTFLQQSEKGLDAFAILPKGQDADNSIVMKYDAIRNRKGYRKAVILTTGTETATISNPNIVIWDIKKICMAYINAFKKVVTEKAPEEKPATPKGRFAVIDFETTGVNYDFRRPPMDEIISVAIIDQDGNTLLDTYCDTVKVKSWYEAQCINGISPRDVKGYPTFAEILPKVIKILSSFDYVISYNVPFEKGFLENYARLYTPTDFSIYNIKWGNDPMEMFMDYMNSRRFLKLETAAEHFGYKYNAHNALEDTKATLYVYKALCGK